MIPGIVAGQASAYTPPPPFGGKAPDEVAGLTMWIDGTTASTLYLSSGEANVSSDGDAVGVAQSRGGLSKGFQRAGPTEGALYKVAIVNGKSVMRFDGVDDRYFSRNVSAGTVVSPAPVGDFLGASAKTFVAALSIVGADANQANVYQNDAVFEDAGGYVGLMVSNVDASTVRLHAYNYDGNANAATADVAKSTWFVVAYKHDGTDVKIKVNGGLWTSVASGATNGWSPTTVTLMLGSNYQTSRLEFDLAHAAFYNAAVSDSDVDDVMTWMASEIGISI